VKEGVLAAEGVVGFGFLRGRRMGFEIGKFWVVDGGGEEVEDPSGEETRFFIGVTAVQGVVVVSDGVTAFEGIDGRLVELGTTHHNVGIHGGSLLSGLLGGGGKLLELHPITKRIYSIYFI